MLSYLVVIIIGLLFYEALRRKPNLSWFFFFLLPIGLSPFWMQNPDGGFFFWSKTYLLLVGACLISWMRTHPNQTKKVHFLIVYGLYFLNIMIPIWKLFSLSTLLSCITGVSGLLLIALFPSINSLSLDSNKYRDFLWDAPYSWILQYNLWDWLLFAIALPDKAVIQISLLLAPFLVSLVDRKQWLQARVYTLSLYLIMGISLYNWINPEIASKQIDENTILILSICCLCWTSISFLKVYTSKVKNFWTS